jgi:hypothetical protein
LPVRARLYSITYAGSNSLAVDGPMKRYFLKSMTVILICGFLARIGAAWARPVCEDGLNTRHRQDVTSAIPCRKPSSRLLRYVGSVSVPEFESFFSADHLREGQPVGRLQITWIGSNFRKHFLGKIEGHKPARELDVYQLKVFANDSAIISDIGRPVEVTLHDIWVLLKRQLHGQHGLLRTDARPNVFYVRGALGKLWAVDTVWSGAGWEIGASRLDDPRLWHRDINVISR